MKFLTFIGSIVVLLILNIDLTASERGILKRHKRYIEWGPDIAGPYCEARRGGCCPGRLDDCSMPILGTRCYCDIFCNQTADDCCPDFWSFCMGQRSTPAPVREACRYGGVPYRPNSRLQINCNNCTCSPDRRNPGRYQWDCTKETCLIQPNIITAVRDGRYGWTASNYSSMWGMTLDEGFRYKLGTIAPDEIVMRMSPIKIRNNDRLPQNFDARQEWPGMVHGIRDQGRCAASFAFSTTALAADRLSIESRGQFMEELSPQHIISCNRRNGNGGCNGGYLDRAWWFLRKRGVVTSDCYPYMSGYSDSPGICMVTSNQNGGTCPSRIPFRKEKVFHATPPYRIAATEEDIMAEIKMNGPVQASFKVKEDFFMYKSGVYRHANIVPDILSTRRKTEYHSVRIIGWGVDRTNRRYEKYWLCANSWGPYWGENGYFRIARGTNECQIESFVLGVWGKVEADVELSRLLAKFRRERLQSSFNRDQLRRQRRRQRRRRHLRSHRQHKHHKGHHKTH